MLIENEGLHANGYMYLLYTRCQTLFLLNDSANYCTSNIITGPGVCVDDKKRNGFSKKNNKKHIKNT